MELHKWIMELQKGNLIYTEHKSEQTTPEMIEKKLSVWIPREIIQTEHKFV